MIHITVRGKSIEEVDRRTQEIKKRIAEKSTAALEALFKDVNTDDVLNRLRPSTAVAVRAALASIRVPEVEVE